MIMAFRYKIKRTNLICPEDWFFGPHPVTGEFTRCRMKDFDQEALEKMVQNPDFSKLVAKYVEIEKVPEKVEIRRKSRKKKVNEPTESSAGTEEAEASENTETTS